MSPGFREEDKITTGMIIRSGSALISASTSKAVQPRQVEVQNDQPGTGRAGVLASPAEEPQGLPAISDGVKAAVPAGLGEGLTHYERIPGVIFDVQYIDNGLFAFEGVAVGVSVPG
jgi:hypothetical protein